MPHYMVNVEDKEYDIEVEYRAGGYETRINGRAVEVVGHRLGETRMLLLIGGRSHEVDVRSDGYDNRKTVFLHGSEVSADIEDFNLAQLRKTAGMTSGPAMARDLKAPMPGLILKVCVGPGDKVQKGAQLPIVEAMKMENVIKAVGDGTIKNILVETGASVEKGDKLLEFE